MNEELVYFIKNGNKVKRYNDDGTFNKNIDIELANRAIKMKEKFMDEVYKYEEYFNEFIKYISQFDKLEVLSYFSFLRILTGKKGIEDEALNIFQLEFLQCILLGDNLSEKKELLTQEHIERIKEYLLVLPMLMDLKDLTEIENKNNVEKIELSIINEIISERAFVRNHRTEHIENNINTALLKELDEISINKYDIKYSYIMKMLNDILSNINNKINNYLRTMPEDSLDQIASDICDICTFSIEEYLELYRGGVSQKAIQEILNKFSYYLTDKVIVNPEDVFINNPVWNKFLIKVDDKRYFFPPIDSFISRILEIFRLLIVEDDETKKRYDDIKGAFLEKKIVEIFSDKFNNFDIYYNCHVSNDKGKDFESDVILIYKNYAIVIEAKANDISNFTYNGNFQKFKDDFNTIVRTPRTQANNIKKILENSKGEVVKLNKKGGETVDLDLRAVNEIISFSVSLSGIKRLCNSQLSWFDYWSEKSKADEKDIKKIMPHIQLKHLYIISELLPTEAEFIHYVKERTKIEQTVRYDGDELDLLVVYLNRKFKAEFKSVNDKKYVDSMLGADEELNDYFFNRVDKSSFKKNKLFLNALKAESIKNKANAEKEILICEIPYKLQNIILKEVERLKVEFIDFKKTNPMISHIYIEPITNDYIGVFPVLYRNHFNELQMKSHLKKDKNLVKLLYKVKSSDLKEFYIVGIKCDKQGDISLGFIEKIK
ncbi:NERD domain-containing protein [Clostridium sporogenes]|uniref:nuclease-related domain-containing protein n=1 Tax=Clostridium sporogenes TaxID=1509 RepID=UPI0022387AAF|nr:nuclease-related domain-containing protein [Clostridium sporogenes]MCW6092373.1 NERD domain-containing protein [Clostridium sporogenes]